MCFMCPISLQLKHLTSRIGQYLFQCMPSLPQHLHTPCVLFGLGALTPSPCTSIGSGVAGKTEPCGWGRSPCLLLNSSSTSYALSPPCRRTSFSTTSGNVLIADSVSLVLA